MGMVWPSSAAVERWLPLHNQTCGMRGSLYTRPKQVNLSIGASGTHV
jgi:hypothetical protein